MGLEINLCLINMKDQLKSLQKFRLANARIDPTKSNRTMKQSDKRT